MHAACDVMNDMKRITLTFCLHFPALPLQLWRQSEQNEADQSLDQIQATSLTTELLLSKMTSPMHSLANVLGPRVCLRQYWNYVCIYVK